MEAWCIGALEQIRSTNISSLIEKTQLAPKVTDAKIELNKQTYFTNHVQIHQMSANVMLSLLYYDYR